MPLDEIYCYLIVRVYEETMINIYCMYGEHIYYSKRTIASVTVDHIPHTR